MNNTAYKHDDKMRHLVKDNNAIANNLVRIEDIQQ